MFELVTAETIWPFTINAHYHGAKFRTSFRDGNTRYLEGTIELPRGEWFHYAAVGGKDVFLAYVNGKLDTELELQGKSYTEKTDYLLGRNYTGMVDELKLYNRALSDAEVQKLPAGSE